MHFSARTLSTSLLAALLLSAALLAGCSLLESGPETAPSGVTEQVQAGQRREAILTLNSLIRDEPQNASLHAERAEIYLELGSPGKATEDVDKALELDPKLADAWRIKAAILLSAKTVGPVLSPRSAPGMDDKTTPEEIAQAREALSRCLELDPQNALAHTLLGRAERLSGDPEAALEELRRAEEMDPEQPRTFAELADTSVELQHWTEAAEFYDEAASLDPDSVELLLSAAHAHWNIGEFGEAIDQLERASTLRPSDHNIFANLALVYAADGDDDEAIHYDSLARRKAALQNVRYVSPIFIDDDGGVRPAVIPDGLEAERRAKGELTEDENAPAKSSVVSTAESAPENATEATEQPAAEEPHRDLMAEARKALDDGNPDAALALVSEYLDKAEPGAEDYCFQARVLNTLKEPGMAADAARKAIRLDPDNFCGYNNLGVITAASDPQAAIAVFTKGIERLPHAAVLLNERGKLHLNAEQYEAAEKDFDACVEADPNTPVYRLHRAIARYHLGEYDKALEDADKFLLLSPNSPEGYRTRAAIHRKLGHDEQAAKDLETEKSLQAQ